ncbi:hypothetical protein IZ6_07560 [Terrihabitans soli]|uniref:Uncharacterized protein n=1 Tax=Terrihabitans soli TaxID=708113 RepID=A0A6S6QSI8_9HYPH|nr:hypothetical protein [Terrihabitans soli]BCJ90021.1 hypothetical protein IZ6_07560 [Terrihabitans soli]
MSAALKFRPILEGEILAPVSPGQIPFHPIANCFRMIEGTARAKFDFDVARHGLREDIVIHEGMILDGRNRYVAAVASGLIKPTDDFCHRDSDGKPKTYKPPFVEYDVRREGDPVAWVFSKNIARRHMDESELAMAGARLANMRQGERTDLQPAAADDAEPSAPVQKVSQAQAAEIVGVSTRSVASAAKVLRQGAPETIKAVDAGELPVKTAAKIAAAPKEEQPALVEGARKRREAHVWERADLEWYVEPVICTKALLSVESFFGQILDPSCGGGNVVKAVLADPRGIPVFGSDIVRRVPEETAWFLREHDFLKDDFEKLGIDHRHAPLNIINNPPYFGAQGTEDFIRKALSLATGKVAIFTELRFLGSKSRAEGLFREHPPTRIHIVLPRPSCPPGTYIEAGHKPQGGTADWCWIVWDREAIGMPTQFNWLVMEEDNGRTDI